MPIRRPGCRTLLVAVTAAVLTGCGASEPAPAVPATPPATPSATPTAPPPTAADGTNLDACRDGACEVRVDGPVDIPVAPGSGYRYIRVVQNESRLGLEIRTVQGSFARVGGNGRASGGEGVVEIEQLGDGAAAVVRVIPP